MSPLAMVIAALLVVAPVAHVEKTAAQLEAAAQLAKVDVALLTALAFHESSLRHDARSRVGAMGMLQLYHPRYVRPWRSDCAVSPRDCSALNVVYGAMALRDALQKCGSHVRAVGAYRSGRCIVRARERATVALAQTIRYRLKHPSTRPLVAPRLP